MVGGPNLLGKLSMSLSPMLLITNTAHAPVIIKARISSPPTCHNDEREGLSFLVVRLGTEGSTQVDYFSLFQ